MRILLLDIETAPNLVHCWGIWQQNVAINQIIKPGYTLCWAAKWLGEEEIYYASLEHDKEFMLNTIYQMLDEADAVVHYNGTKFDIPTLNQEFISIGLTPPSSFKQIDLLRTTRGQFRFPSNKLDYVARVLGLGQKHAHKGHDLWIGCMEDDAESWKVMQEYNIQDVVLLEKLYNKLLPWIKNHPNVGLYNKEEGPVCPVCGGKHLHKRGVAHTTVGTYTRYRCSDCGKWSRSRKSEKTTAKVSLVGV